jgi:hypothetical protein
VRAGFWPSLKRCCLNPKFELFCTNPLNLGRTGKKSYWHFCSLWNSEQLLFYEKLQIRFSFETTD